MATSRYRPRPPYNAADYVALQPGSTLGPYEVLALIGAGGMGEVYRARDLRLNRDVAIKVLPPDRVDDESRRRRFVQEAQAISALNHPHIITIYEIESANGIDFIVMEYVRGKSLDTLIPHRGMRLNEFLRIAIPIADALAAAHVHGIIHRDLKPANVMVGTDGGVKVLDFGLAKLMGDERAADETDAASQFHRISSRDADPAETLTAAGAVSAPGKIAGTPAYMAPEQALGERLDARSDIFSFGAMLYEMLTGDGAFVGASTRRDVGGCCSRATKATRRDCAEYSRRPAKADFALFAQRTGAALPAHQRCECRVARDQGRLGVRFCGRGTNLPSASQGHDHSVDRSCERPRRNDMAAEIPT